MRRNDGDGGNRDGRRGKVADVNADMVLDLENWQKSSNQKEKKMFNCLYGLQVLRELLEKCRQIICHSIILYKLMFSWST